MRSPKRWFGWVAARLATACLALIVAAVAPGCGGGRGARSPEVGRETLARVAEEARESRDKRGDQPDAAEMFYRAKRQPRDPGVEPMEAYRSARLRMAAMPRHSLRLGSVVDRAEVSGGGASASAAGTVSLAGWEPVGPGNIGGRTRVLLVNPADHAGMYACGVSGGVWKSLDAGAHWEALSDDLANITVNALVMDPSDPETLYAGTGEGYFREEVRGTGLPLRGAGIFKSSDGGGSWSRLAATTSEDFHWVNDIVVSTNEPRRIYAATRTGVWRSVDAGESWQQVLATQVTGGCLDLAARTDRATDTLFASCGTFERASIYRNEAAETAGPWTTVFSEATMGRTSLAIAPSNQDVVYALAALNDPQHREQYDQGLLGVYRSTSGGASGSWQTRVRYDNTSKLNSLLLTNPLAASYRECGFAPYNSYVTMGWYVNIIAVDPVDPEIVWAAGVDLFRSNNGGSSWGPVTYWWTDDREPSFVHADQHGITFHPAYDGTANQSMFAVGDGGIFRTDNARAAVGSTLDAVCNPRASQVAWTSLNHNFGVTQFYHGAPFPGGESYLGGTQDNGTLLGTDARGHDGWANILGGDGGYVAVDPTDVSTIYAETQWFNFYSSADGGRTFDSSVSGISEPSSNFLFITPFVLDPNEPRRLWTGGKRLWRTENRAVRWSAASAMLGDGGSVSALAVAPGAPDRVVAGTSRGTIYRSASALTAAASTTWQGVKPRDGFVTWLVFDPADPDVVWATYGGFGGAHVWRSGDGGATWAATDGSGAAALPDIPVHCILVDPTDPTRLFLATDLGVFVSPDAGASWLVENTGFASVVTESLALTTSAEGRPVLFAFTHGRGAWRVEIVEDDGVDQRPLRRRIPAAG